MFNRYVGLYLVAVSTASIAYFALKNYREKLEAERKSLAEMQKAIDLVADFNKNVPSDQYTLDMLSALREGTLADFFEKESKKFNSSRTI